MKRNEDYTTFEHMLEMSKTLGISVIFTEEFSDKNISILDKTNNSKNFSYNCGVNKDTRWINNGLYETYIPKEDTVPDGWVIGRIGSHGGRVGIYDKSRYDKITQARKETIARDGNKNTGMKRSKEIREKFRINALLPKHIEKSKNNMSWANNKCSCLVCKKETSVVWLARKHKDCRLFLSE